MSTNNNFDIKETVNRNIEKHQMPNFSNHRSLIGWCSMNYPKVLVNPLYVPKPDHKQRDYDLDHLFQAKQPKDRNTQEFTRPFSNSQYNTQAQGYKPSTLTLCTTKQTVKDEIFETVHKKAEPYSAVLPLSCVVSHSKEGDFSRKIRQIGEVTYTPSYESEEIRHLKKLPNSILTEQNLMEIMNPKLQFLDLQNSDWISNELVNKIGYFAPNIRELNLSSTLITDDVIIELSISCVNLVALDISKCKQISEHGVKTFLTNHTILEKFSANHNPNSINDESLKPLNANPNLVGLNINFCSNVTTDSIQCIVNNSLKQLSIASIHNIKGEVLIRVLENSYRTLVSIDFSFNARDDINNALMLKVGNCGQLESLVLTGCSKITDEATQNLIGGEKAKGKSPDGFPNLRVLKLGGLINLSDSIHNLIKKCPKLELLEMNNLEKLTDNFLENIKNHPSLERVLLNFTPNITPAKLQEISESNKRMKICRNITNMTDPTDDGLRMPLPPANLKKKKKKKKKK